MRELNKLLNLHWRICLICEIIFSKTVCGIFLIFCRLRFINNFVVKNNFLEPLNHQKLYITEKFFKKNFYISFVDVVCKNKLKIFF